MEVFLTIIKITINKKNLVGKRHMEALKQAALEREKRRLAAQAVEDSVAAQEEEKNQPSVQMGDTEMQDDLNGDAEAQEQDEDAGADGQAEGWGEDGGEDGDDGAGWYDYDEEESDMVKEAIEATRKLKEQKEKITPVRITFHAPNYREGQIARIVGDFTDWVPVTMRMHTVREIDEDPSKYNKFFVVVKLAKGFRYRFVFEVDGVEVVDCSG